MSLPIAAYPFPKGCGVLLLEPIPLHSLIADASSESAAVFLVQARELRMFLAS